MDLLTDLQLFKKDTVLQIKFIILTLGGFDVVELEVGNPGGAAGLGECDQQVVQPLKPKNSS